MQQHRRAAGRGIITGYMLKLVRESIPLSQERLAADLGVDRATIQSWETGRRPFTSVAFGQAVAIRSKLGRLGADTTLLAALDDAAEADYLLGEIVDGAPETTDIAQHPLGWSVLTHTVTDLLNWAIVGQPPALVAHRPTVSRRRGPVASAPLLEASERTAFFANLQVIADRTAGREEHSVLLHRQACFLAGIDPTKAATTWLCDITKTRAPFTTFRAWSPLWPDARSVATSLAKQGDPQLLRDFIANAHPDEACERAGLNYWAYWVGEVGHRQRDDSFMTDRTLPWRGVQLLRHLVERLHSEHPFIDLNVHSVWALLAARRGLIHDNLDLGRELMRRGTQLLDEDGLSVQSRRELTSVLYGLRLDGLTSEEHT